MQQTSDLVRMHIYNL